jgi:alpha/beta hydrolase fold
MKLSSNIVSDLLLLRQRQQVKNVLQIWDRQSFSTSSRCTQVIPNAFIRYKNRQCTSNFQLEWPITKINCRQAHHSRTNAPFLSRYLATATTTDKSTAKDGAMADEYGEMTADGETYVEPNFGLESGVILPQAQLRYQTYGTLNAEKTNVLVICHALTGNASLHSWWGGLLGPGKAFDTSKYWVVCCNILGSAYGSTSPQSIDPNTQRPYGKHFPDISVQDTVRLQLNLLQNHLGIQSIQAVIGGSFGGMQAMEFAVQAGSSQGQYFSSDGT